MLKKKVLITDVDNTLFDWFSMWYKSFSRMMHEVARISGLPVEKLYAEAQQLHQLHGTSEYAFVLEEMPSVIELYGTREGIKQALQSAVQIFEQSRNEFLQPYSGVVETLRALKNCGIQVFAFSESREHYSSHRIKTLGLDGIIDILYCPTDHQLPVDWEKPSFLVHTQYHPLDGQFKKPDPSILLKILDDSEVDTSEAIYIGDSKAKDIKMAIDANVDYVWFEHGSTHLQNRKEDYELLRRVTHWTQNEVEAERLIAEGIKGLSVDPGRIIHEYPEVMRFFQQN